MIITSQFCNVNLILAPPSSHVIVLMLDFSRLLFELT